MASTPPPPQTTLTVVQYNTLADALCTGNDAGFTSLPPAELAWASRGDALVRALLLGGLVRSLPPDALRQGWARGPLARARLPSPPPPRAQPAETQ